MYTFLYVRIFISLRSAIAGHIVTLYLTFWGIARLFSKPNVLFYIPTSRVGEFQFLHILTSTFYYLSFYVVGGKWDLAVILISLLLMANDVQHLFMLLLDICVSSLEKCLFRSFAILIWIICLLLLNFKCPLCIGYTSPLIRFANTFSHFLGFLFTFLKCVLWSTKFLLLINPIYLFFSLMLELLVWYLRDIV